MCPGATTLRAMATSWWAASQTQTQVMSWGWGGAGGGEGRGGGRELQMPQGSALFAPGESRELSDQQR